MWNASQVNGPLNIPIYGPPAEDGSLPIIGEVPGYHLNACPSLASDALAPYVVEPQAPVNVWAGAPTLFLKFPDEATAKSALADYWIEQDAP